VCQVRILVPLQVITNVCEVNIFSDIEMDTPGHYASARSQEHTVLPQRVALGKSSGARSAMNTGVYCNCVVIQKECNFFLTGCDLNWTVTITITNVVWPRKERKTLWLPVH
jgi:hypothetical protein